MIHRILTPLDNSTYTQTAIKYSCEIARKRKAVVTGMVVLDLLEIEKKIGPIAPGGIALAELLEKKELMEAQKHIETLTESLSSACKSYRVAHNEFKEQGSPSKNIIKESFFFDLLIIGMRTFFHFETSDRPGDSLDEILDHTITPILAVPQSFQQLKKVLVVLDSTPASVRALQRFAHFAENADYEITLLMEHKDETYARFYLKRAEEYLNCYGLNRITSEYINRSVIDEIDTNYMDKSDLIVVGMHQHKTLKEFVVGSLPKYLIKENKKALFIVQ